MLDVKYVGSYPSITSCPKDQRPEYAFIGRSNVGEIFVNQYANEKKWLSENLQKTWKNSND